MKNIQPIVFAVLLAGFAGSALAQVDDPLKAARNALTIGQPRQALAILEPLEAGRAGEPLFDYLLGVARLDSGDPERAVFALERVLAVQPSNAQARAEIGRAYLMLGERDAGVKELENTRGMEIPDEARQTINNYLNAFGAGPTRFNGYLEASVGHDSNVNSGISSGSVAIPALGNLTFQISPDGRERPASYVGVSGGLSFYRPVAERWSVVGGASFSQRFNENYARFNVRTLDGNLGLRYAVGKNAYTVGLQTQVFDVNDQRNRTATGLVAQWQHQLDSQTQLSVFGQYTQLRYPGQSLRDANRTVAGLAFAKVFTYAWTPSLYGSVYGGKESELDGNVPHLGHTPWGVRFGGQLKPSSTLSLFANASYEHRRYGGDDPLFLVRRADRQFDLRLGLTYEPYRFWSVSPQVSYTRNDSNVAINDYSRTVVSVSVRRDF